MGAANVHKAYLNWRPHLDDRPFCVLVYMAFRARDHDAEPWYGAGHEELAMVALGLTWSSKREWLAALRSVSRAVKPLLATGAIRASTRARPGRQAVYRLSLDGPTYDGERRVNNSGNTPERTTLSDVRESENVRRSADIRTTLSGASYDGERRTKEKEEEEEQRTSKAKLRNGELWKAAHALAVNGFATPARHADEPTP